MKFTSTISFWLLAVIAAAWPTNANNRVAIIDNTPKVCDGVCPSCDCHTHDSPVCPKDLAAVALEKYLVSDDDYTGLFAFQIGLYGDIVPRVIRPGAPFFLFPPYYAYGGVTGSCAPIEPVTPPGPPVSYSCTMTLNLAQGKLMLRGALPSYAKCFDYIISLKTDPSLIPRTYSGCSRREDGVCCGDMAVTGGTGEFALTKGQVRVCYIVDLCAGPEPDPEESPIILGEELGLGLVFEFDGLKGCEKCCTRGYYYDLLYFSGCP